MLGATIPSASSTVLATIHPASDLGINASKASVVGKPGAASVWLKVRALHA